jgi:hypothetical protein
MSPKAQGAFSGSFSGSFSGGFSGAFVPEFSGAMAGGGAWHVRERWRESALEGAAKVIYERAAYRVREAALAATEASLARARAEARKEADVASGDMFEEAGVSGGAGRGKR